MHTKFIIPKNNNKVQSCHGNGGRINLCHPDCRPLEKTALDLCSQISVSDCCCHIKTSIECSNVQQCKYKFTYIYHIS